MEMFLRCSSRSRPSGHKRKYLLPTRSSSLALTAHRLGFTNNLAIDRGRNNGVVYKLGAVDVGVDFGGLKELFVAAVRDDLAAIQHQDLIGIANGADPLGDHK